MPLLRQRIKARRAKKGRVLHKKLGSLMEEVADAKNDDDDDDDDKEDGGSKKKRSGKK